MTQGPVPGAESTAQGPAEPRDEALLQGFLSGEGAMFEKLVYRYETPLYAFIGRLTGKPAETPDLFQETFLRVFQNAHTFTGASSFKTWLYAIAINTCRSEARKSRREDCRRTFSEVERVAAPPNRAADAESNEIGERIAAAVAGLPQEQREVFLLRAYDEMTYHEIADVLRRPTGTVKSQMRAALFHVRRELHDIAEAYDLGSVERGTP